MRYFRHGLAFLVTAVPFFFCYGLSLLTAKTAIYMFDTIGKSTTGYLLYRASVRWRTRAGAVDRFADKIAGVKGETAQP